MRALTHDEFVKKVENTHKNDIKILGIYKNSRTKILVAHLCGYEWKTNPNELSRGHGCPICGKNKRKTTEIFKKQIYDLVCDEYIIIGEYLSTHTKIKFKHNTCGLEFEMEPNAFISGQRCPNERYVKSAYNNTIPFELIKKKMFDTTNGEYEIISNFKATTHKADIKHLKCGKVFRNSPTRIINGGIGCPNCYKSKGEDVIEQYLDENDYEYKKQFKIKECKNKRALPFDFAVFNGNDLSFLIEYDGIQHFKPKFGIESFNNIVYNDNIKNRYCNENRINLIRIKYNRSENPRIFKSKIITQLEEKLDSINKAIPSQA